MPNFYGKYYYTLDSKGRTLIPPAFKEILSSNYSPRLVFVNDVFDKCLCAYPVEEWNSLVEQVKGMPQTSDAVKYFRRRVLGSAVECDIDKQGRVLIPSALRVDAHLNNENEIVLVGQGLTIEIWDKNEYEGVADPSKLDEDTVSKYKEQLANHGL
ncbi:MAG: division/cell wall cluster transcriptional repressor MraZ [Thermodesulfovibrionia bacterium]|nr:division/cell wall cluster transcriptional repressor MraZ [Thermodesulfovibrionia bacterium]